MRALAIAAAVLSVGLFGGANTEAKVEIPAGYDLLETDSATTYQVVALPPGALAPFCDAGFDGTVYFKGVPSDCFLGTCGLHPKDTVIRRVAPADPNPPFEPVPIEIVALNLTSVQPITLLCPGGSQLWNVDVSVPEGDLNQTQGDMTITHDPSTNGGTFTSYLPVTPWVTFRRVSDNATVGPMLAPKIEFCVSDTRCTGTAGPAGRWSHVANPLDDPAGDLVVSFTDRTNFFPGVICPDCPGGGGQIKKVLTEEEALQAKHGIYVAEKKHHYKCYDIVGPALNQVVNLVDEFGNQTVTVGVPKFLCPPALKNGRGDLLIPHLKCYDISGATPNVLVDLLTQFGLEPLVRVMQAKLLCVPALKEVLSPTPVPPPPGPPPPSPHYTCYEIAGAAPPATVSIETQFGLEPVVPILAPKYKCVPSIKNGEGYRKHPDLKCYNILGNDPPHVVNLETQFGLETNRPVGQAKLLCIPVKEVLHASPQVPAMTAWGTAAFVLLVLGLAAVFLTRWLRGRTA